MTPRAIELATTSILNEAEVDEDVDDDNEETLVAVGKFVRNGNGCQYPYPQNITAAVSQILTNEKTPDESDEGYELEFPTIYHFPEHSEEFDRVGGSPD